MPSGDYMRRTKIVRFQNRQWTKKLYLVEHLIPHRSSPASDVITAYDSVHVFRNATAQKRRDSEAKC
uniref:Transposase n=1 Tax=Romanomermis culicivorax TaxID=13658 RepID=A0A915K2G6_ROMCU